MDTATFLLEVMKLRASGLITPRQAKALIRIVLPTLPQEGLNDLFGEGGESV